MHKISFYNKCIIRLYMFRALLCSYLFFPLWRCGPTRAMASSFLRFPDHTQRHITVGRTPLDEWSTRRRDLYLTTHNTYNRQTSMPPEGFEPTISAGERPQTYALDRAVVLIIRRSKFYYTASGIVTPVGGCPVHRLREDCGVTKPAELNS